MTSPHQPQPCTRDCPWNGTEMCVQCLLSAEALAEHQVSLGILCGLKQTYLPHGLPPCIVGNVVDWSGPHVADTAEVAA